MSLFMFGRTISWLSLRLLIFYDTNILFACLMGEAGNHVSRGASCGGYRTSRSSREEVGENVAVIMISADGSWKAATESNDQRDHRTSINVPEVLSQQEKCTANDAPDIMELSDGDDEMDIVGASENECLKPLLVNYENQLRNLCTDGVNQSHTSHAEDAHGNTISGSAPTNSMLSPVLADATSPALISKYENSMPSYCYVGSRMVYTLLRGRIGLLRVFM
ncbi:uncharacterized protein LOC141721599 isoform X2 [Apium graveolens]|uniref:uncharacterized protein LOC141721599 isoform X2 n=1 Tax=Apium graveolens TaxID=4045 RepID=UPI003D79BCB6